MAVGGAQWSEAVAVGSLAFVEKINAIVGIKAVAHKLCRACYYIIKDQLVCDLTKAFALKRRVGPLNAPLQIISFWSSLLLKESPEELQNWFLESGLIPFVRETFHERSAIHQEIRPNKSGNPRYRPHVVSGIVAAAK